MEHVQTHYVTARVHGNKGRELKHANKYKDLMRGVCVVRFIKNNADEKDTSSGGTSRSSQHSLCVPAVYKIKINMNKEHIHIMASAQARSNVDAINEETK